MIDKRLLHYEILDKLGEGGMGEVWKARDTTLDREVAIKVLPEVFASDGERLARFEREAKLLASLNHSGIAVVHGLHEQEGLHFLAMELVPGEDLARRLDRGPLGIDEALFVSVQVAEALEAAHSRGVIHRDLKPANIILTPDGKAKVLDFGLAKTAETDASSSGPSMTRSPTITEEATLAGTILGTAAYMSPEQARGRPVDRRTDIWSFGCVLFECLTARGLFGGESVSDSLGAILHKEPDWSLLPDSIPPTVRLLLQRCLTKDPNGRLHDIADARIELAHAIEDPEGSAVGLALESSGVAESQVGVAKRPWVTAAVAALVLGLGFAVGWLSRPSAEKAPLRKLDLGIELSNQDVPDLAISPDGSRIAYTDQNLLWVRSLDALEPRQLDGTEGARYPFWSPDSSEIGYFVGTQVFRVPAVGGSNVPIADLGDNAGGAGGAWREDGQIVVASGESELRQVSSLGGELRKFVPLAEGEQDHHDPFALPGDRGVLFVGHLVMGPAGSLYIFRDGQRRELLSLPSESLDLPVYSPSGHVLFTRGGGRATEGIWALPFSLETVQVEGEPFLVASDAAVGSVAADGTLIFVHRPPTGREQLVWVDRNGQRLANIGPERRRLHQPSLSPQGERLAFISQARDNRRSADLLVRDLKRGTEARLTSDQTMKYRMGWTPDGVYVAFGSFNVGTSEAAVQIVAADGSGTPRVVADQAVFMDVSPDGDSILVGKSKDGTNMGRRTRLEFWLVPVADGSEPTKLPDIPDRPTHGVISPNGRWLAYRAERSEGGQIFLTRYPELSGRWQVSVRNGNRPYWNPVGDRLYYVEDSTLTEVRVGDGAEPDLGQPKPVFELDDTLPSSPRYTTVAKGDERFVTVGWVDQEDREISRPSIKVVQNWSREFDR